MGVEEAAGVCGSPETEGKVVLRRAAAARAAGATAKVRRVSLGTRTGTRLLLAEE